MRTGRIYTLYAGSHGPTCYSSAYDRDSKDIWHVAARSLKQAMYLCARDVWSVDGSFGIVEHHGSDGVWRDYDGTEDWEATYKHSEAWAPCREIDMTRTKPVVQSHHNA